MLIFGKRLALAASSGSLFYRQRPTLRTLLLAVYLFLPGLHTLCQWNLSSLLEVFRQVVAGIAHVHDSGIVHRDLKADNVVVCSRDPLQVKITDFGSAVVLNESGTKYASCIGHHGHGHADVSCWAC